MEVRYISALIDMFVGKKASDVLHKCASYLASTLIGGSRRQFM